MSVVDVREFGGIRIPNRLHNRLDRIAKAVRLRWATALRRGLKLSAPARLDATDLTEAEVAAAFDAIAEAAGDHPFAMSEEWHVPTPHVAAAARAAEPSAAAREPAEASAEAPKGKRKGGGKPAAEAPTEAPTEAPKGKRKGGGKPAAEAPTEAPTEAPKGKRKGGGKPAAEAPTEAPAEAPKGKQGDGPKHSEGYGVKIQSWVSEPQAAALRAWGSVTVGPDASMTQILRAACEYFRIGGGF